MVLLPDTSHGKVYTDEIAPNLNAGDMLMFAHGFSIHFGTVTPPADVDVTMIAPKGPGHLVRRTYEEGIGTPALVAVQQDATGKALAAGARLRRRHRRRSRGDHRDQLQGGDRDRSLRRADGPVRRISELIRSGFDTLVEAGYQPEIAYFECLHEMKLIIDLIYEGGLSWMRYSVSDTAEWGDYTSGPRVVDERTRETMHRVLAEIQDGSFAKRWIAEADGGFPEFLAKRREARSSQLEEVGRELRKMMPWLKSEEKVPPS